VPTEEPKPVDMSPEAIADRIATVGQLYRVCLSLGSARPLPGPPEPVVSGEGTK
jgi:hypothetical protein